MKKITCSVCLMAVAAMLAPRPAPAQGPVEPWVTEIGAPQYFAVFVEDVDRSVAWYRTVFGLDELGGSAAEDGSWRIENLGSEQLLVELIRDEGGPGECDFRSGRATQVTHRPRHITDCSGRSTAWLAAEPERYATIIIKLIIG